MLLLLITALLYGVMRSVVVFGVVLLASKISLVRRGLSNKAEETNTVDDVEDGEAAEAFNNSFVMYENPIEIIVNNFFTKYTYEKNNNNNY